MKSTMLLKNWKQRFKERYADAAFETASYLSPGSDCCLLIHVSPEHRDDGGEYSAHLHVEFYMEHGIYITGIVMEAPLPATPAKA